MAAFLCGCSAPPSQRVPSLRMDVRVVCNDQNRPSHGVYVFGPLLILGILERQVTNLCVIAYIQHLFDLSSDAELGRFVAGSLCPNGHAILPVPHAEHGSTDLVGLVELFADQRQHCVQPPGVQYGLAPAALGHVDGPLPPLCAGRIFPFWLDPFFEEVKVRSVAQPARWDDVVVHTPEFFYGCERDHLSHGASPVGWVLFSRRHVEPERPSVFQRMLGEGLSSFFLAFHFVGHGEMQHKHRHVARS
mmetsp:Transcript_4851/g.30947  ORF Transcript_4851/g.30947 Transcript_4851/m.30947 type:complete len:247 (+) Transcript_4851:2339-3079(+)